MDRINKSSNGIQWIILFITWACLIALPFLYFPYNRDFSPLHSHRFVLWTIYSNVTLLAFYFINTQILIPKFLGKRKTWIFIIIIILAFFLYLVGFNHLSIVSPETHKIIEHWKRHNNRPIPRSLLFFSPGPIILYLITLIFSSGSKILEQWFMAEKMKEMVTKQQLETELSMLRSQVNPHFLFNTLNSIYTLALIKDDNAAPAVMKLSKIMRYTLEEAQNNNISLASEMEFSKNYVQLQQLRLSQNTTVKTDIKGDLDHTFIPPLILIPFIENAFKYGVSAHEASEIFIGINISPEENGKNKIEFRCTNPILKTQSETEGTGSGIENVRKRLNLVFGKDNYHLLTHAINDGKNYEVVLTLYTKQ